MGAYDGAVEQQPFQIGFGGQGGEHAIQCFALDPTVVAPFDGPIVTQPCRKVAPATTRVGLTCRLSAFVPLNWERVHVPPADDETP